MDKSYRNRRFRCVPAAMIAVFVVVSPGQTEDFTPVMNTSARAWGDYNNDGWPDLFGGSTLRTNNGDGTFTRTQPFNDLVHTINVSLGDYNNDGFIDVMGYRAGELAEGGPRMYTNNGGTSWTNDSSKFGPATTTPAWVHRDTQWGDFNNDGYLDIYVSAWCEPWVGPPDDDLIYMSNGGVTFAHTWTAGIDWHGHGISTCDFDRDGDLDIYVSNYWLTPNYLWLNDGFDGVVGLVDVAGEYGADDDGNTIGSAIGDFNNDGDFDIFVCNFAHPGNPTLKFLENLGRFEDYHFEDRGTGGVLQQEPNGAAALADFDNDGHLDLFVSVVGGYGPERPQFYRNNGNFSFSNVTADYGFENLTQSQNHSGTMYKAAWGDYDNDGFVDLLIENKLWRNPGAANWPDNHWLKVRLEGGQGANGPINGSAIGSQVRIDVPGLGTVTRQVEAGTGEGMANDLVLHFGFGDHPGPVNLDIFWSDGSEMTVSDVEVDQLVTVTLRSCWLQRTLPATYTRAFGETVSVTLEARNISGETIVTETPPVGWRIVDAGGGFVEPNTIEFTFTDDGTATYELLPSDSCEIAVFSSDVVGPDCGALGVQGPFTIACALATQGALLLTEGDEITFHRGSQAPSPGWQELEFDDSNWEPGTLGIGYGDDDDMTVLNDMSTNYSAVFGRARFDLRDHDIVSREELGSLRLSVRFDDGFAVYLNGEEIARPNIPDGEITELTNAILKVQDAPLTCEVDNETEGCAVLLVPVEFLELGENVLAFSVHNDEVGSSDLSFIPTLTASTAAPPPPLGVGSAITFLRGTAPPPTGWEQPVFDDSAWEVGTFGIGYGDFDDDTVLDDMQNNYPSVFGRAIFDLGDHGLRADLVESLELRVRFDDAFVLYFNGQEIARPNMPAGEVTEQTFADLVNPVEDAPAVCDVHNPLNGCAIIPVPLGLLVNGENVFAFSVHNKTLTSSDLSFIPALIVETIVVVEEGFVRGDCTGDGEVDIVDVMFLLFHNFLGTTAPPCPAACDANGNGDIGGVSDSVYLLMSQYRAGPAPVDPFPQCGLGLLPTDTTLGCDPSLVDCP